jgi:hypothetical protein
MKVFSFCLYGTEDNYYFGLLENIKIICEHFPDFEIYVYKGVCKEEWVFDSSIHIIETGKNGVVNMLFRHLPITFADVGFVRDADSRITERDRWCITQFLESDKEYHVIRDHFWHRSCVSGGMFGWKTTLPIDIDTKGEYQYGDDEKYLNKVLYPKIKDRLLVHTNICAYKDEYFCPIMIPQQDSTDFVGNVIWNGIPKFQYWINIHEQVIFLRSIDSFAFIKHLTDTINPLDIPYDKRSSFFDAVYTANYYLNDVEKCKYWLSQFEFAELTLHNYTNANYLFSKLGKKIIASFDPTREPQNDEVIIVYGNYPDWHHALPCSNKVYRHASLFSSIKHDSVESNSCWNNVDIIYILNLETRVDRYYEMLTILASVHAPLDRIYHYKAKKDPVSAYIGATQNHVDVMKHFENSDHKTCLILEDDFVFIDDRQCVWNSIAELFRKQYEYTIFFLSLSRIGKREPYDDLLSISHQYCTTSSGYFLTKPSSKEVYAVAEMGVNKMRETNDYTTFCIDRYWCSLPKKYFFKKKLGFQRPSYSNNTANIECHLD